MHAFNHFTILGVDKAGDASKRGKKTKLKHKGGGSECERKQKGTKAGLQWLSGPAALKVTSSHTGKLSVRGTCPPQKTQSSGPEHSHAVKSLQSPSRASASCRSEMDKTSSKDTEEGNRACTLVQSRLAWKTMASPAPTVDALKVDILFFPVPTKVQGGRVK